MRKSTRRGGGKRKASRCWKGGAASVNDTSMNASSRLSLAQGGDYQTIHAKQHGGMAPVGYTGVLDDSLRATARVAVLDESMGAIQGMSDQAGGGRKKKYTHKNIMAMLKKMKKQNGGSAKKRSRSSQKRSFTHADIIKMVKALRNQKGGSNNLSQAQDYSAPGMLLSPSAEARALGGMNPEWKLASDPTAFVPNRI